MYKQDVNNKIYGPPVSNCDDYALFLKVLQYMHDARGYSEYLTKYRIRQGSLSRNKMKKFKSFFELMVGFEHINIFLSVFYLLTNLLIKHIWKYKIMPPRSHRQKHELKNIYCYAAIFNNKEAA
jgi:hypothetical protein